MLDRYFAAFIMTYNRPKVLGQTISMLQEQTHPPEYILVVDNSENHETEKLITDKPYPNLAYYRVGYNSGPAGAAKIGLEKLTLMGFSWIYWGDDDNPPRDKFEFENLFRILRQETINEEKIGILGGKGGRLNKFTGRVCSLTNAQLKKNEVVEVDFVPGGHTLLVNAEVVRDKVLPDGTLFFGFEELDFSLKVKEAGYKLIVDARTWLRVREKANNMQSFFRPRASGFGKLNNLQREYYSARNLLYIFFHHGLYSPLIFNILKTYFKSFVGFRYGLLYGFSNFQVQWSALKDFFSGKRGQNTRVW